MQNTTYQVLQQGQELVQVFENSGICVMADAQCNAQTRVQVLLEFLHDREVDLEDLAEVCDCTSSRSSALMKVF